VSRTGAKEKVKVDFTVLRQKLLDHFYLVSFFYFHLGSNYQRFLEEIKDGTSSASEGVR